jgi:rRNA-processing protein FCF1
MKLLITDTNVLFDVIKTGVLPEFFSLGYDICTTVFVIEEIKQATQKELVETYIRSNQLTVFEFTGEDIDDIVSFDEVRSLKRFTDKSVIWKSLQLNCPMLTGDNKMKKIAESIGIEVHGSIWIIEELLNSRMISEARAIELYEHLMEINSWLPKDEIEKRINKLR